jgi:pimeloyl-ACP methyl ester carboxylesterase
VPVVVERLEVGVGDVTVEALAAGPTDGELVLLLHGMPPEARAFADVLPPLAEAGYRAVAPTQRGFSRMNRPLRGRDYRWGLFAADVLALARTLGSERPHIVGHDLGAIVGWELAARQPDRVATLTAVSVPHPAAYVAALPRSLQALRSLYVPVFWTPVLSEQLLGGADGAVLRRLLVASGLERERADAYLDRLLPGGGLTAAFRWYRDLSVRDMAALGPVPVPTTFVWSTGEVLLDRVGAELTERHVTGPYRFATLEGSHWIPEQQPDRLAELILERVGAGGA